MYEYDSLLSGDFSAISHALLVTDENIAFYTRP